jgi:small GTP-binding protein
MYDLCPKIVLFGDLGVGKRTLAHKFLGNIFQSDSKMTMGVDFYTKSLTVDQHKVKLQVWLFGSEERFRFLTPTYVLGARGGLFMYDITNYNSIAHINDWLTVVRKKIRVEDAFPIIAIGNKTDLSEHREVSSEDGIKIAKSRGLDGFIECSAKSGENIEEAFQALSRLIINSESL